MRWLLVIALLAAMPATASAAEVDLMVVGKERVLRAPTEVRLKVRAVKVAGRRCRLGGATPLSVLVAAKLKLGLRDYGHCGKRPRDAAGLYVTRVKREREKGRGGWVYKVGRRAGSTGAADPAGPFGTGKRIHGGQRITWFWCEQNQAGGCQRTLEVRPDRAGAAPLRSPALPCGWDRRPLSRAPTGRPCSRCRPQAARCACRRSAPVWSAPSRARWPSDEAARPPSACAAARRGLRLRRR
jgi:hypothetical protein